MTRGVAAGLLVLVAIAVIQAALTGAPSHRGLSFDERRYEVWATNLYVNGFYGDTANSQLAREELRTVPYTAYISPGYPFYLVALKTIHADNSVTRRGVQAALVGLIVLIVGLIGFRLFGPIAALLSAGILIATGVLATYAQLTLSEILSTATLMGALALVYFGLKRGSWRMLVGAGVIFGYSILVRPQVLLLPIPIAAFIFFSSGRRRRAAFLAGVFLLASFGTVLPWTIRNELRLHSFVPVASYTWINFWQVNNPRANGHFALPERWLPVAEVRQIRSLPEVEQDNAWRHLALTWVRAHPVAAFKGWVRDARLYGATPDPWVRIWYTLHGWRPPRLDERLLYPFVLLAALLAAFVRRRWEYMGLFTITVVYFVLFFSFFLPLARYRETVLPVLALLAAGAPEMVMGLIASRRARATAGSASEQPGDSPLTPALEH